MVNFGSLAAEIVSLVWGTPANFNWFRVLAALLHGTLGVGVSQTLRRSTEGATYIRRGCHHVEHWPTFLVVIIARHMFSSLALLPRDAWYVLEMATDLFHNPTQPPGVGINNSFASKRYGKKLSYRRGTVRCAMTVEILSAVGLLKCDFSYNCAGVQPLHSCMKNRILKGHTINVWPRRSLNVIGIATIQ